MGANIDYSTRPSDPGKIIVISGGLVRLLTENGEHLPATVRDYDVEGADVDDVLSDENGEPYLIYDI